jgi:4-diphosphocytidyl-2-C-methyl-D-erythritol kinase
MTSTVTVFAHAKLNLGLRVLGCRSDGYHLLESVFVPIALADSLEIEFGDLGPVAGSPAVEIGFEIESDPGLPGAGAVGPPERNLAVRAARSFCGEAGLSGRLQLRLSKRIPVGAGLGGGSSDAGTVLRALDARFPGCVAAERLLGLAVALGADVPFFLRATPSRVGGIGEEISPLTGLRPLSLLLANPGVSLSTADVFSAFDRAQSALTLGPSRSTLRALEGPGAAPRSADSLVTAFNSALSSRANSERSKASSAMTIPNLLTNDLEPFATFLCPQVSELQEQIRRLGTHNTAMSGSGATVYGVFPDDETARDALERAEFKAPIWACATRSLGEPKQ